MPEKPALDPTIMARQGAARQSVRPTKAQSNRLDGIELRVVSRGHPQPRLPHQERP